METNNRFIYALQAGIVAIVATAIAVYLATYILSRLSTPVSSIYVSFLAASCAIPGVIGLAIWYGLAASKYIYVATILAVLLNCTLVIWVLYRIPAVETTENTTIIRHTPEYLNLTSGLSIVACVTIASLLAAGAFWLFLSKVRA